MQANDPLSPVMQGRFRMKGRPAAVCALFVAVWWVASAAARAGDLEVAEIAPGVFLRAGVQEEAAPANGGHIANIGFVVGEERVAVIDTGGSLAEGRALRRAIRRVTELPIGYVILTHVHPDHVFGAAAFEQDAPAVVGHANLPDALARRGGYYLERLDALLGPTAAGTRVVMPSMVVASATELDLGGRILELTAHPTAHTNNDLSVFDRRTATLWLSDLLFVERIPVLDGSLTGWLRVIDDLAAIEARRVVPGHGPVPADWHAALGAQRRYLERVADGVREFIRRRGTLEQAVDGVGRDEAGRWLLFDAYHGRNVTAAFVELEWE
jgi:quinoprotein relay system zinc metallohydrolase 2